MRDKGFVFEINDLARAKQGVSFKDALDIENTLEFDGVKAVSNITADLTFMRILDGIHVLVNNLSSEMEFNCNKCAGKFGQKIHVNQAERVFHFEEQEVEDKSDQYYVNTKHMTVNLSEFIRQEIILHFPMIPVCSNSCKGLCPNCGRDLNKETCNCEDKDSHKPLSDLKNLIKD